MTDQLLPDELMNEEDFGQEQEMYIEEEETAQTARYFDSIYFDFDQGDFVQDSGGKLKEATGQEAWEQWCQKVLKTQRYSYDAYSTDIGIDFDKVMRSESHAEAENILSREIREALLADPLGRTVSVDQIKFEWEAEQLSALVTIQGTDGNVEMKTIWEER